MSTYPGVYLFYNKKLKGRQLIGEWREDGKIARINLTRNFGIVEKEDAKDWERSKYEELNAVKKKSTTLSALVSKYLQSVVEPTRGEKAVEVDRKNYFNQFIFYFQNKSYFALTTSDLIHYRQVLEDKLKPSSVKRTISALRGFIKWAQEENYWNIYTDELIEEWKCGKTRVTKAQLLDTEQIIDLIRAVEINDTEKYHSSRKDKNAYYSGKKSQTANFKHRSLIWFFVFMVKYRMKLFQIYALEWTHIDFVNSRIRVGKNKYRDIDDPIIEEFLLRQYDIAKGDRYVIGENEKGEPSKITPKNWKNILRYANLSGVLKRSLWQTIRLYELAGISCGAKKAFDEIGVELEGRAQKKKDLKLIEKELNKTINQVFKVRYDWMVKN